MTKSLVIKETSISEGLPQKWFALHEERERERRESIARINTSTPRSHFDAVNCYQKYAHKAI